jgi:hypothetical protein
VSLLKRQAARRDFVAFAGLIASPETGGFTSGGSLAGAIALPANADIWITCSEISVQGDFQILMSNRVISVPDLAADVFHHLGWFERATDVGLAGNLVCDVTFYIADGIGAKFPILIGSIT